MHSILLLVSFCVVATVHSRNVELRPDITINTATRNLDASTQLLKETQTLEIENSGSRAVKEYVIAISPSQADNVAFVSAKKGSDGLTVEKVTVAAWEDNSAFYAVNIGDLRSGSKQKLEITIVYTHVLKPYPAKITQAENQNVVLEASATLYSPYKVLSQKTTIKLSSSNVHSYSKDASLAPAIQDASTITYGAYENVEKFTAKAVRVHYENNTPFLAITKMNRLIEVSHWGNIAVEETIDILHVGAKLKGPFSRYDFQRDHRQSSPVVKSFKTLLPASASDVYYRDEIGNISTSNLRERDESVDLDIRPRFPLFGGWKTHYVIGYNVPSYAYLFRRGKQFALKMRFVDLIYDNFVVDELETRIILPERASAIQLNVPYDVQRKPQETHYTYLDYSGRPVVVASKKKVVANHIQDFTLEYKFDTATMIYEPLMIVSAFFLLFLLVIFYVRLDFTIAKDTASEGRLKVAGLLENIRAVLDDRSSSYDALADAVDAARTKKDLSLLSNAKKKQEAELKRLTQQFNDMTNQLRQDSPEIGERLNEVTRLDRQIRDQINVLVAAGERLLAGKGNKQQFLDTEKNTKQKVDEWKTKIDKVAYSF